MQKGQLNDEDLTTLQMLGINDDVIPLKDTQYDKNNDHHIRDVIKNRYVLLDEASRDLVS